MRTIYGIRVEWIDELESYHCEEYFFSNEKEGNEAIYRIRIGYHADAKIRKFRVISSIEESGW